MKSFNLCKMAFLMLMSSISMTAVAGITEYTLVLERQPVNITGKTVHKLLINNSLPGPVLEFTEGDEAVIHVSNKLDETSSLHWHGLLLPASMDGVPGLAGFHGIAPGETYTYRFNIRQQGTYWYHAHSNGQEQDGLYGAIVIKPHHKDSVQTDRDYVIVLSDFHQQDADDIIANLKLSSEYYQYNRRTLTDLLGDIGEQGTAPALSNSAMWGKMRMLPTDIADVSGYTFLMNGKSPDQNWTGLFLSGERVRLRFINASAMTFYDIRIPGLLMTVVSADGQPVESVQVDEFRFGAAETYDVIVTPKDDRTYTLVAESIDRSGFALGTLAPRTGMIGPVPKARARPLLTMADMPHTSETSTVAAMDHAAMGHVMPDAGVDFVTGVPGSGWTQTGAPAEATTLAYTDLRYLQTQTDVRPPTRDIEIRLGGNMDRYLWTLNGKKYSQSPAPIDLKFGERVRLKFVNDTMMAHPMHLHGMFVQLENGQPANKLPNKHTVIIAPGDSYSVLLTANEPGEWAIHCHLQFHSMTGMMGKVIVAVAADNNDIQTKTKPPVQPDTELNVEELKHVH